jgi:hypothetical protein
MSMLIAIINVISWSGFWAFGYIALTASELTQSQILIAAVLAGVAFLTGVIAYLKLSRGHKVNNSALGFTHANEQG